MIEDGFIDVSLMLKPAVYGLVHKGVVVYIGKTTTPLSRLSNHRNSKTLRRIKTAFKTQVVQRSMVFDSIWIRPCFSMDMDKLEVELIRKYKPKYNIAFNLDATPITAAEVLDLVAAQRANVVRA